MYTHYTTFAHISHRRTETTEPAPDGTVQEGSSHPSGIEPNPCFEWRNWMVRMPCNVLWVLRPTFYYSGKSTQVPAFILEDQLLKGRHCRIYCTEPRRFSAISLAQRVSCELGEPAGTVGTGSSLVGYAIRLESNINRRTRLAYVTNGIALRMLEGGSGQGGQGTAFDEITVWVSATLGIGLCTHRATSTSSSTKSTSEQLSLTSSSSCSSLYWCKGLI